MTSAWRHCHTKHRVVHGVAHAFVARAVSMKHSDNIMGRSAGRKWHSENSLHRERHSNEYHLMAMKSVGKGQLV